MRPTHVQAAYSPLSPTWLHAGFLMFISLFLYLFIFFISLSSASGILPPYFQRVEDEVIAKIFSIEEQSLINSNWEEHLFGGIDCFIQTICSSIFDKCRANSEVLCQFKEKNHLFNMGSSPCVGFLFKIKLGGYCFRLFEEQNLWWHFVSLINCVSCQKWWWRHFVTLTEVSIH